MAHIELLKAEKQTFVENLAAVKVSEQEITNQYAALQTAIEREKDTNREAEKMMFKIMAEQNEVHAILARIKGEDDRIKIIEENFNRELQEGAMLVGRNVLDFVQHKIVKGD